MNSHLAVIQRMMAPFPSLVGQVMVVGVQDALSAGLALRAGFSAVWVSSFGVATAHFQRDDEKLCRLSTTQRVLEICKQVSIPVIVDAQTGYESEGGLQITVRSFEAAGASGMCLEDKAEPRQNTLIKADHALLTRLEFCQKLKLAVRSRVNQSFILIARSDALSFGESVDQVAARLIAYAEAGVDAVLLHVRSAQLHMLSELYSKITLPVALGLIMADSPPMNSETIKSSGVSFCIFPHVAMRYAVPAMIHGYEETLNPCETRCKSAGYATVTEITDLIKNSNDTNPIRHSPSTIEMLEWCPHRHGCLNFRRNGPTFCSNCDTQICEDHYHDDTRHFRLCKTCFDTHVECLDTPQVHFPILGKEPETCANSFYCYSYGSYLLKTAKACSDCGCSPLPNHYHDIVANKRYCLACIKKHTLQKHG